MGFELILPFLRPIEPLLLDESVREIMGILGHGRKEPPLKRKRQTKCMDEVFAAQAAGVRSAMC